MVQSCQFKFEDPGIESPCSVCNFSSSELKRQCCELVIFNYCFNNYKQGVEGCIKFLDLLIAGGRCHYNTLSEEEHEAIVAGVTEGHKIKS
jgi:hypothetical protein